MTDMKLRDQVSWPKSRIRMVIAGGSEALDLSVLEGEP